MNVNIILNFLAQFQNRAQGGQFRVVNIYMGAHILNAVACLQAERLVYTVFYFLFGKERLIFFPALNAFKQRAG